MRAFLGDAIDVWGRMAEVCASARDITEVIPADVVGHEDDDVWFLVRCLTRHDGAEERRSNGQQPPAVMDYFLFHYLVSSVWVELTFPRWTEPLPGSGACYR